jgi:exocyst complex component 6
LEKGLDHDLHAELVQEAKNNALRIGQVCHDHADVFLASVAAVAALATPSADLADGLKDAQEELNSNTAGPMYEASQQYEQARLSHARARTLNVMVDACQGIAVQLERARKQAALGRPRSALDAVDLARTALTTPIESLFQGKDERLYKETLVGEEQVITDNINTATIDSSAGPGQSASQQPGQQQPQASQQQVTQQLQTKQKLTNLEQTPFGKRAAIFLPRIENEVLMSAKRGLNRWFAAQRAGGEGAKAGRAVLRLSAHSMAVGPGALGLGGTLPPSFTWRAKMADNLIARVGQSSKVARAARQGYWFDRDANKDAARLESDTQQGTDRSAEAFAAAFGWYRCWEEDAQLLVDPSEWAVFLANAEERGGSRHGSSGGLNSSRHGLTGSRHGGGDRLKNSRHGTKKSLGFRATTNSRTKAYQEISSTLGKKSSKSGLWTELLTPEILAIKSSTS